MTQKARRSLRAAKAHLRSHDYDFASSKAYYATFHVMQAALLTKRLSFSKHAGVISGFSEHFIKTDIFPKDFGRKIQQLRQDRERGDYGYILTVGSADAQRDVAAAPEIVSAVEALLRLFLRDPHLTHQIYRSGDYFASGQKGLTFEEVFGEPLIPKKRTRRRAS